MSNRWLCVLLASGAVALSAAASAQQLRLAQVQQPQLRDDEQILPSQIVRPPAVTQSAPGEAVPKAAKPPEPARAVACSGSFAKDSAHLKLAQAFGAQNIVFADV